MSRKKQQLTKLIGKVKELGRTKGHEKDHHFLSFNFVECSSYLQYKRESGDPAMTKLVKKRWQRCI